MISIRNLSKRFGDHAILSEVSLEISRGETVVLLGASGSGKTTLLRCIVGLERFDAGEIEVNDLLLLSTDHGPDHQEKLRDIRQRCGLVFQQYHLFPHLNVLQNLVLAPLHVRRAAGSAANATAMQLLDQVGLANKASQRPLKLSGGEQQRVAIARALAMEPQYLLYDEPTSSLDGKRAQEIWAIMRSLSQKGYTQLIVTHQEQLAEALDCRVVRLAEGKIATTT